MSRATERQRRSVGRRPAWPGTSHDGLRVTTAVSMLRATDRHRGSDPTAGLRGRGTQRRTTSERHHCRPGDRCALVEPAHRQVAVQAAVARPDGRRLLGAPPRVVRAVTVLSRLSVPSLAIRGSSISASTSRAGSPSTSPQVSLQFGCSRPVLDATASTAVERQGRKVEFGPAATSSRSRSRSHPDDVRGPVAGRHRRCGGVDAADVSVPPCRRVGARRSRARRSSPWACSCAVRRRYRRPLRVADGARGDRRHDPRRHHLGRHLLGVRLPGHAADGDRLPDDPRLLAVRHDRRVRPGRGERATYRRRRAGRGRPRQRVDQPGVDAIVEHVDLGAVAGAVSLLVVGAWLLGQGTLHGVRPGPAHRHAHRGVLVDLRGHTRARRAQGRPTVGEHLVGEDLRTVVVRGVGILSPATGRRRGRVSTGRASDGRGGCLPRRD